MSLQFGHQRLHFAALRKIMQGQQLFALNTCCAFVSGLCQRLRVMEADIG